MANVNGVYESLLQGISQQPTRDRQPGQCTNSINLVPSPVSGLHDRPPLEWVTTFPSALAAQDAKFHHYTSGAERYIIGILDNAVHVTDFEGNPITVTMDGDAPAYLASGTGLLRDRLQCLTVGDVTLVCNRQVTPQVLVNTKPSWSDSLVYFRSISPGRTLSLTVTAPGKPTVTITHAIRPTVSDTPVATDGTTVNRDRDLQARVVQAQTDVVAKTINDALNANGSFTSNYTVNTQGSVMSIASKTGVDVTLSVTDDAGGTSIYCINREVPQPSALPVYAPHGYFVRITGDGSNVKDDYFLQYLAPSNTGFTSQPGRWKEVTFPKENFRMDAQSMPHALIRKSDGTFAFTALSKDKVAGIAGAETIFWDDREAGSDVSNPFPDFFQAPIQDMGLFQDRLYFIAQESITFSRSRNYWNFFKKSATTELADDPINKASNSNEVAQLRYAVQHNRDLILFADDSQFRITGSKPITSSNVSLSVTTNFGTDLKTEPVAAGEVIFFPFRTGSYSGIREFYTNNQADSNNARPITSHVERLLEGSVIELRANTQEDILLVRAEDNPNEILVYHYLWQDNERVQAAWGRWKFCTNKDINYMFFENSTLHVIMTDREVTPNVHGYVVQLEDSNVPSLIHNVYLDERITAEAVNTSFNLPTGYPIDANEKYWVVQGEGCPFPGLHAPLTIDGTKVNLDMDMNGGQVYFGHFCERSYVPSMPIVRDRNGQYIKPKRFIIGDFKVDYDDSGPFVAKISHPAYGAYEYKITNRIVGQSLWGQVDLATSQGVSPCRMPVDDLKLEYVATNYLPMKLSSIQWSGQFITTGRRI